MVDDPAAVPHDHEHEDCEAPELLLLLAVGQPLRFAELHGRRAAAPVTLLRAFGQAEPPPADAPGQAAGTL